MVNNAVPCVDQTKLPILPKDKIYPLKNVIKGCGKLGAQMTDLELLSTQGEDKFLIDNGMNSTMDTLIGFEKLIKVHKGEFQLFAENWIKITNNFSQNSTSLITNS